MNEAQEQRTAARAQLEELPVPNMMTEAEAYARIDSLGDVGKTLKQGSPENLSRLYRALHLQLNYHPVERAVDATISVRVVSECVRGGLELVLVAPNAALGVHGTMVADGRVSCLGGDVGPTGSAVPARHCLSEFREG